jgi:hypothetical protein
MLELENETLGYIYLLCLLTQETQARMTGGY